MSGSGKDMLGVVGSSWDRVRAGMFPDTLVVAEMDQGATERCQIKSKGCKGRECWKCSLKLPVAVVCGVY